MARISIGVVHLLLAAGLCMQTQAMAVELESGIYYNPQFQGRGYFVEVQNGIVSVIVYTHDEETGRPDWFLASGQLRDDAGEIPGTDPRTLAGYYPIHWMTAPLYRYSNGPCIVCGPRRDAQGGVLPLSQERVGQISLYVDALRSPYVYVEPDLGQIDADVKFELVKLERTNFGFPLLGRREERSSQLFDQRGRWLLAFEGRSRSTVDVIWEPVQVVDLGVPAGLPAQRAYRAEYKDLGSQWTMTCHIGYRFLPAESRPAFVPRSGCEFAEGGAVVFSALQQDIGLNRVAAFSGALPADSSETLRGSLDIRGYRLD